MPLTVEHNRTRLAPRSQGPRRRRAFVRCCGLSRLPLNGLEDTLKLRKQLVEFVAPLRQAAHKYSDNFMMKQLEIIRRHLGEVTIVQQ